MKKYLRFGEIPENEQSTNFIKMTFDENEKFTWALQTLGADTAFSKYVPENAKEPGVSVFEMGKDGMPVLHNMRQALSLASRIGNKIYELSGDQAGRGNDGEPLIKNICVIKSRRIATEKLANHIISFLVKNFMDVIPPKEEKEGDYEIYKFYKEYQININTGEKKECICGIIEEGFTKIPGHTYFCFCGWEFHFPIAGFDTSIGASK